MSETFSFMKEKLHISKSHLQCTEVEGVQSEGNRDFLCKRTLRKYQLLSASTKNTFKPNNVFSYLLKIFISLLFPPARCVTKAASKLLK